MGLFPEVLYVSDRAELDLIPDGRFGGSGKYGQNDQDIP